MKGKWMEWVVLGSFVAGMLVGCVAISPTSGTGAGGVQPGSVEIVPARNESVPQSDAMGLLYERTYLGGRNKAAEAALTKMIEAAAAAYPSAGEGDQVTWDMLAPERDAEAALPIASPYSLGATYRHPLPELVTLPSADAAMTNAATRLDTIEATHLASEAERKAHAAEAALTKMIDAAAASYPSAGQGDQAAWKAQAAEQEVENAFQLYRTGERTP